MEIVSTDDFIDSLRGVVIEGGDSNADGMHLNLSDGRVLVIAGIVYVGRLESETLQ